MLGDRSAMDVVVKREMKDVRENARCGRVEKWV
jgi:hypothetical protein